MDGWLGWAAEDGFACGEGCGAGEGEVAFADFGDGEEGGLSASCDEWVGDPVFAGVVLVPEFGPVDELVEEFVGCAGDGCWVAAEVFGGGFLPVATMSCLGVVAEA